MFRRLIRASVLVIALTGCARDGDTVALVAPFDARTHLGELTAVWSNSGEERGFAGGVRLKEPEVRFRYRVDVHNRSGTKLFVRLGSFQLVAADGLEVGHDSASAECTLNAGDTHGVLAGDVWIAKPAAAAVHAFRLSHFTVPLSEGSRTRYRDWLLQGRPDKTEAVDAEIAGYAAAPSCASQ